MNWAEAGWPDPHSLLAKPKWATINRDCFDQYRFCFSFFIYTLVVDFASFRIIWTREGGPFPGRNCDQKKCWFAHHSKDMYGCCCWACPWMAAIKHRNWWSFIISGGRLGGHLRLMGGRAAGSLVQFNLFPDCLEHHLLATSQLPHVIILEFLS